jgi:uncharacterized protein (UPF0333 family)
MSSDIGKDIALFFLIIAIIIFSVTAGTFFAIGYYSGKQKQFNSDLYVVVSKSCNELNGKIISKVDEDCNNVYCVYDNYKNINTVNLSRVCEETVKRFKK